MSDNVLSMKFNIFSEVVYLRLLIHSAIS